MVGGVAATRPIYFTQTRNREIFFFAHMASPKDRHWSLPVIRSISPLTHEVLAGPSGGWSKKPWSITAAFDNLPCVEPTDCVGCLTSFEAVSV